MHDIVSHAVLGVRFHDLNKDKLKQVLSDFLREPRSHTVVTPNPEFVLEANRDPAYRSLLNASDLALPDGVGLRFAVAASSNERLSHRHTGVDVLVTLVEIAAKQHVPLVLLGGSAFSLDQAKQYFATQQEGIHIIGLDPGNVPDRETDLLPNPILAQIRELGTCIVAVGLGAGKTGRQGRQERAMREIALDAPNARIVIGVGGAIDFHGKVTKRAPAVLRRLGFEWAWRLVQEPWRWRRIFRAVIAFPIAVAWDTLHHARFLRACWNVALENYRHFRGL